MGKWIIRILIALLLLGLGVKAGYVLAENISAEELGVTPEMMPMLRAGLLWVTPAQAQALQDVIAGLQKENEELKKQLIKERWNSHT